MAIEPGRAMDPPLYGLFAELLEYPHARLAETARACEARLAAFDPEAAQLLAEFRRFVSAASPGLVEEVYTGTFDLDAAYHPYLGYHLFGESYKRSVFMLELKERYQAHGFDHGAELPDHLAVVLRFLSGLEDEDAAVELGREGVLPVLDQMTEGDRANEGVEEPEERPLNREAYHHLLLALRLVLRRSLPAATELVAEPA